MEEQDIRMAIDRHRAASAAGDQIAEHEIYHDDAICAYPQSGEVIHGRRNLQALRSHHPDRPSGFEVRRIAGEEQIWNTEYVIIYRGKRAYTVSVMQFQDGRCRPRLNTSPIVSTLCLAHAVGRAGSVIRQYPDSQDENMKKTDAKQDQPASELISNRIAELGDWRGKTLARMRKLIKAADPDVVEEWKWMGTPVWSHDGIICTGESYKDKVKLTFAKGASLKDPTRLFNSSLDGNVRRAIDIMEGEEVDGPAFKTLVRQAIALNSSGKSGKSKPSKKAKP